MFRAGFLIGERALALATCAVSVAALTSCGGGSTGNSQDSGVNKTYLSVEATDADGDTPAVPVARHGRQHRQPQRQLHRLDDAREPWHPLRLRDDQRWPRRICRAAVRRQRRPARPASSLASADRARRPGGDRCGGRHRPAALSIHRRHPVPAGERRCPGGTHGLPARCPGAVVRPVHRQPGVRRHHRPERRPRPAQAGGGHDLQRALRGAERHAAAGLRQASSPTTKPPFAASPRC